MPRWIETEGGTLVNLDTSAGIYIRQTGHATIDGGSTHLHQAVVLLGQGGYMELASGPKDELDKLLEQLASRVLDGQLFHVSELRPAPLFGDQPPEAGA